MKILGHKTRSIFERYDIDSEDDLREAAALVSAPKQTVGKIEGNIGGSEETGLHCLPVEVRCQRTA
jgi:hypothetical protein